MSANEAPRLFQIGDRVNVNMAAYVKWYEVHIQQIGWVDESMNGDNMTITHYNDYDGNPVCEGNGWGGSIPPQFLERI